MALGLGIKPDELQSNTPENKGQTIPVNFVGQKKLPEQPAVITEQPPIDQGIPTAPPAPKLEANSNPIDSDKEEEKAIKEIEIGGLEAAVAQINREIEQLESREPIAQAARERIGTYKKEYNRFAVTMAIIGGQKEPYIPIVENINRLPKAIIFVNGIREIMASCAGYAHYRQIFSPENITAVRGKGLDKEREIDEFSKQLLEKPRKQEVIKKEPIQTFQGPGILEYKEAA